VTRGDAVESCHRIAAAVVDDGQLIGKSRNPEMVTYWRSCAKPFQVMPLIQAGQVDELGWGFDEIALACASHGGEPEHVAIAERMLSDIGLEEGDLACGVHDPLSPRGARILRESGERPTRLHNNCSGKHAAMLARAGLSKWPTEGYDRAEHPVQRSITACVSRWTGVPEEKLILGVDGCGVVVYALPLESMALSYSNLAIAAQQNEEGPRRIVDAMLANPFLVGGTDRFDSILMEETEGRILCKIGAEGVHCAAVMDAGIGIALKAEDGAVRAQYPALIAILQQLGALPEDLSPRLADFAWKPVRNTRHEIVGEVRLRSAI
jgi:L-asparaginase II